ncbi:hypothetical protein Efla_002299 [Eimeria flavescens]
MLHEAGALLPTASYPLQLSQTCDEKQQLQQQQQQEDAAAAGLAPSEHGEAAGSEDAYSSTSNARSSSGSSSSNSKNSSSNSSSSNSSRSNSNAGMASPRGAAVNSREELQHASAAAHRQQQQQQQRDGADRPRAQQQQEQEQQQQQQEQQQVFSAFVPWPQRAAATPRSGPSPAAGRRPLRRELEALQQGLAAAAAASSTSSSSSRRHANESSMGRAVRRQASKLKRLTAGLLSRSLSASALGASSFAAAASLGGGAGSHDPRGGCVDSRVLVGEDALLSELPLEGEEPPRPLQPVVAWSRSLEGLGRSSNVEGSVVTLLNHSSPLKTSLLHAAGSNEAPAAAAAAAAGDAKSLLLQGDSCPYVPGFTEIIRQLGPLIPRPPAAEADVNSGPEAASEEEAAAAATEEAAADPEAAPEAAAREAAAADANLVGSASFGVSGEAAAAAAAEAAAAEAAAAEAAATASATGEGRAAEVSEPAAADSKQETAANLEEEAPPLRAYTAAGSHRETESDEPHIDASGEAAAAAAAAEADAADAVRESPPTAAEEAAAEATPIAAAYEDSAAAAGEAAEQADTAAAALSEEEDAAAAAAAELAAAAAAGAPEEDPPRSMPLIGTEEMAAALGIPEADILAAEAAAADTTADTAAAADTAAVRRGDPGGDGHRYGREEDASVFEEEMQGGHQTTGSRRLTSRGSEEEGETLEARQLRLGLSDFPEWLMQVNADADEEKQNPYKAVRLRKTGLRRYEEDAAADAAAAQRIRSHLERLQQHAHAAAAARPRAPSRLSVVEAGGASPHPSGGDSRSSRSASALHEPAWRRRRPQQQQQQQQKQEGGSRADFPLAAAGKGLRDPRPAASPAVGEADDTERREALQQTAAAAAGGSSVAALRARFERSSADWFSGELSRFARRSETGGEGPEEGTAQ